MVTRTVLCFVVGLIPSSILADEPVRLADQPLVILRSGGFDAKAAEDYFKDLRESLGIGSKLAGQIEKQQAHVVVTKLDKPASGMMVYLSPGLLPSVEQVQFSEVADHEEFVRLIHARSKASGSVSTLDGSGDLYSMVSTNSWRVKVDEIRPVSNSEILDDPQADQSSPEDAAGDPEIAIDDTPAQATSNVSISIGASTGGGVVVRSSTSNGEGKLIEENGETFREYSSSQTSYFRYHDGFMFESQTNALHTMNLPSGDSLRLMDNADVNGEVVFHPDRIPMGLRLLGWNALSTAAGAELQQRDEESDADYSVRRSAGDAGLALIRSAMFDTEKVSAWMKVPFDVNPVQGEFRISARKNSDLGRTLREVASAERRFAPILNDEAAATVYLAAHVPEEWRNVASSYITSWSDEISSSTDVTDAERAATLGWFKSISAVAEHGHVEFCVKLGWSKESGGVIYGGMQLDDNPELLSSFQSLINSGSDSEAQCELVQLHDLRMLKLLIPSDAGLAPMVLTHCYLANIDSCLWFAIGGEQAHEIIHHSMVRCREAGGKISTPVFTASVDLQRWAGYPQDDQTGLTTLHEQWYSGTSSLLSFLADDFWGGSDQSGEVDTNRHELFDRAMALGGSQALSLVIDTDESGLVIRGDIGEGVARGYAAALVVSLDELVGAVPEAAADQSSTALEKSAE